MRKLITIVFIFLTSASKGTTYYVKVSGGSGSGLDDANAWNYARLNAMAGTLAPGDNVLLKRGDRFFGALTVSVSGTANNRVTYSTYGTGAAPVITGLTVINSWTSLGSNKYQATVNSGNKLNLVLVDSTIALPARYPNAGTANEGYLTVDSRTPTSGIVEGSTTVTLTDASLSSAITWTAATGSEVAVVNNDFTRDVAQVTSFATNTVSWTAVSQQPVNVGYGYFIQNHPQAMDQQNEWYYNSTAGTLQMYSATSPVNVSVATTETLVDLTNRSYITFDGIKFVGADSMVFKFSGTRNINIVNGNISFNGTEGISGGNSDAKAAHILVENNLMNWTNSFAMQVYHIDSSIIRGNTIKNSGTIPGLGKIGAGGYGCIGITGKGNLVEYNDIDSVGGAGVAFAGSYNLVRFNYINFYCRVFTDLAGVYTHNSGPYNDIVSNTITNGYTGASGTPGSIKPYAIYFDEGADSSSAEFNTIVKAAGNGIYIHESRNITLRGNVIALCPTAIALQNDDGTARGYGNVIVSNVLYTDDVSHGLLYVMDNDHVGAGTLISRLDSNTYFRPFNNSGFIRIDTPGVRQFYDVVGINGDYGFETHGVTAVSLPRYTNVITGSNTFSNSSFTTNTSGVTGSDANTAVSLDTKLDGNAVKISSNEPVTTDLNALVELGPMDANKTYEINLSAIGSSLGKANIRVLFMESYYSGYFGDEYSIPLTASRSENTFYVTPTVNKTNATMVLESRSVTTMPYWVDNVTMKEVTSFTPTNLADIVRVEFNASKVSKNISLPGVYIDLKNNLSPGTMGLAPYSSGIVRRIADLLSNLQSRGRLIIK